MNMDALASKAHAKAELALNKIKTAKELREKAREVLKAKGKPIPDILQKGALDDVHQRVVDAQQKLSSKFGTSPKSDGELESKVEAKREKEPAPEMTARMNAEVAKSNNDAEQAEIKSKAAEKKAAMYKDKYDKEHEKEKEEKRNGRAAASADSVKEKAMQQKNALDAKMAKVQMDGKVMELEVKMKEKAEEKMESMTNAAAGPLAGAQPESEADFNHRQIAQEAYNKQVMGYVMSWEKTHGGPMAPKEAEAQADLKADLNKFVDHYENKHAKIKSDISVADTPTRK